MSEENRLELLDDSSKTATLPAKLNDDTKNRSTSLRSAPSVPDGGCMAWTVVIASFLVNGIIFGSLNSFGIFFVELKELFKEDEDVSSKVSLVGSLAIGSTFFCSPISGILTDKLGIQQSAFLGGFIATFGMLLTSLSYHNLQSLYFTFLLFGIGSSITYTPSLAILTHYFHKRIGLANGLVTAGSSVFTIIMPALIQCLLKYLELRETFFVLTGIVSLLLICALTFRPTFKASVKEKEKGCGNFLRNNLNLEIWKNKKYVVWAIGIAIALFGYFIPYVHLPQYVKNINKVEETSYDGGTLLTCIGLTSGLGRIMFGKISDIDSINPVRLQQIAFFFIGIATMCLPLAVLFHSGALIVLIVISSIMGFFDGCFISLLGPIAFKFCGAKGASQAIGFLLGIASVPLTLGPPIAGLLVDHLGSYKIPFIIAGIPPIIGSLFLFILRRIDDSDDISERQKRERLISYEVSPPQI